MSYLGHSYDHTKMKLTTLQKWLRTINWLRREFPPRYPVTICSQSLKGLSGDCIFKNHRFLIRINSKKAFSERIDTILHEYAHALTWFGADCVEDHSDEWGLCYAKLYRAWDEWDYGRAKDDPQTNT